MIDPQSFWDESLPSRKQLIDLVRQWKEMYEKSNKQVDELLTMVKERDATINDAISQIKQMGEQLDRVTTALEWHKRKYG